MTTGVEITAPAAAEPATVTASQEAAREPRWVAELWEQLHRKVSPFSMTAREFFLHPKAFSERWRAGQTPPMNPFWFAASAAAVVATLQSALLQALGAGQRYGVVENALRTLAPYAYYVEIGLAAHLVLFAFGSRRRVSSSVAMALYAGGTMATLGQLAVLATLAGFQLAGALPAEGAPASDASQALTIALSVEMTLSFAAFYTSFSTVMGALHDVGPVRMLVANGAGFLLSSAVCDFLPLPTVHVALKVWEHGHFVMPVLHARALM